jgi:hypothetical protein
MWTLSPSLTAFGGREGVKLLILLASPTGLNPCYRRERWEESRSRGFTSSKIIRFSVRRCSRETPLFNAVAVKRLVEQLASDENLLFLGFAPLAQMDRAQDS